MHSDGTIAGGACRKTSGRSERCPMQPFPEMRFDDFYSYDELTEFMRAAEAAAGDVMRLVSLVQTPQGREVWLATLTDPTTGPPEDKPAYYVQGNVHAHEMYGTSAVLHLLHTLLTTDA